MSIFKRKEEVPIPIDIRLTIVDDESFEEIRQRNQEELKSTFTVRPAEPFTPTTEIAEPGKLDYSQAHKQGFEAGRVGMVPAAIAEDLRRQLTAARRWNDYAGQSWLAEEKEWDKEREDLKADLRAAENRHAKDLADADENYRRLLDAAEYTPSDREQALAEEVTQLRPRAALPEHVADLLNAAEAAYSMTGELPSVVQLYKNGDPCYSVNVQPVRSMLSDALGEMTVPEYDRASEEDTAKFHAWQEEREEWSHLGTIEGFGEVYIKPVEENGITMSLELGFKPVNRLTEIHSSFRVMPEAEEEALAQPLAPDPTEVCVGWPGEPADWYRQIVKKHKRGIDVRVELQQFLNVANLDPTKTPNLYRIENFMTELSKVKPFKEEAEATEQPVPEDEKE